MKEKITFEYNPEIGTAYCLLEKNGTVVAGAAACHPDDMDFASERTGCFIAEVRANIEMLREERKLLSASLKTLNHILSNMQTSKHHNPKSYEAKMIRNQIKTLEKKIGMINADIADEKQYLSEYLQNKEIMYRKHRGQT